MPSQYTAPMATSPSHCETSSVAKPKTLVILKPAYLPGAEYFHLIAQADAFVFLDDVQFEKSTWHHRNRILLNDGPHWLTIPTRRSHLGECLNTVEIDNTKPWRRKHLNSIEFQYRHHPFYGQLQRVLNLLKQEVATTEKLTEVTIPLITAIASKLGLQTSIYRASTLCHTHNITETHRTRRLIALAHALDCEQYLSSPGAKEYLTTDGDFESSDIQLTFSPFEPSAYPQHCHMGEFVSPLAIVDLVANVGWERSAHYIQHGVLP